MFLFKKTALIDVNGEKVSGGKVKKERVREITEEVAYWRKANAVHKWFVDNVQKGKDDCREYTVTKEDLQKLLGLVEEVLKNPEKAQQLLPTFKGFFFGSYEYDDYYFSSLKETQKMLKEVLEEEENPWGEYSYASSW